MTKQRAIKLIMNCKTAYNTCTSEWGKQYWSDVETQLRIMYKKYL